MTDIGPNLEGDLKAGDTVTHVTDDWTEPLPVIERINDYDFPDDPVAFFVAGGFFRTSRLRKVAP